MTQATGGMSGCGGTIEISSNCSDWTDISGWARHIAFSGYDRQTGETFTFDGDNAIIGFGKLNPTEATVRVVYTEVDTDPFGVVWDQHVTACGGSLCVRFNPQGGDTTGEDIFTSGDDSKVVSILPPEMDAAPGDPVMVEFTIRTAAFVKSATA